MEIVVLTENEREVMQPDFLGIPDSNHIITRLQHEFRELQAELDKDSGVMTERNEDTIDLIDYICALFLSARRRSFQKEWNEIIRIHKWHVAVDVGVAQCIKKDQ
jgi:hypothetical protein